MNTEHIKRRRSRWLRCCIVSCLIIVRNILPVIFQFVIVPEFDLMMFVVLVLVPFLNKGKKDKILQTRQHGKQRSTIKKKQHVNRIAKKTTPVFFVCVYRLYAMHYHFLPVLIQFPLLNFFFG